MINTAYEAYQLGKYDGQRGASEDNNPYQDDAELSDAYMDGWRETAYGNIGTGECAA